jgi:hypothetical protein
MVKTVGVLSSYWEGFEYGRDPIKMKRHPIYRMTTK